MLHAHTHQFNLLFVPTYCISPGFPHFCPFCFHVIYVLLFSQVLSSPIPLDLFPHLKPFLFLVSCSTILVMVSIAVKKHHDQKQHGDEMVYLILHDTRKLGPEPKRRTWKQKLKQKPRRNNFSFWLAAQSAFLQHLGSRAQRWHHPQCLGPSHTYHW